MIRDPEVPRGFAVRREGGSTLLVRADLLEAAVARGLARQSGWDALLVGPAPGAGRGATACLDLGGTSARLKRLLRGGLAGPLWRGRFAGRRRLLENVKVPQEAVRRGVATPGPLALLLVEGPPGLYRGYAGFEEVDGAADLLSRFRSAAPPREDELRAAMRAVREMHDAGVHHVDLNLGNLMVREAGDGVEAFVIDLDRAQLRDGPLDLPTRRAELRRLERSYRKHLPGAPAPLWCYELYAADDADLRGRILRGQRLRRTGR